MDDNKIAFIICSNDEIQQKRCISYINALKVPDKMVCEIITVDDSEGLCHAYEQAGLKSDARYKVYLHHDTYIVNRNFIADMLACFSRHKRAGMLGMIGRKNFINRECLYQNEHFGALVENRGNDTITYSHYSRKMDEKVLHIDGLLMMTCVDIPWRDDIFHGWHLYDVSQSLEMDRKGYEIYVPYMKEPWVIHDCGKLSVDDYASDRDKAIEIYNEYFDKKRIYTEYAGTFAGVLSRNYNTSEQLNAKAVENAIILPLKDVRKNITDYSSYEGGVCTKEGDFIAGSAITQRRFSCNRAYKFNYDTVTKSDETVIFGGVFYHHFGVMLLLSLTRFWWIIENIKLPYKIAFLLEPSKKADAENHLKKIMDLFHIPTERYVIVDVPTEFSNIIIPDETLSSVEEVNIKYMEIYDFLRDSIISEYGYCDVKKLYLSRSRYIKFNKKCDGINEEYYENFYKKRGFTILHPEELSLQEQIRYIASADEIVSTYGTLAHMASLFMKEKSSQIILLRTQYIDSWFPIQAAIFNMKIIDWYIVEASKNPYPSLHDEGAFLYCPTHYFKAFLEDCAVAYDDSELVVTISDDNIKKYMIRWLEAYVSPWAFKRLSRPDLFPVLQSLYYMATRKILDINDYL